MAMLLMIYFESAAAAVAPKAYLTKMNALVDLEGPYWAGADFG